MHRSTTLTVAAFAALLTFGATGAEAQGRSREQERTAVRVPRGYEPPPGMCRIWLDGVPAARQPAPTDCATAIKRRPANASLVFGERLREGAAEAPVRRLRGNEAERAREPERRAQPAPERRPPAKAQPEKRDPPSRGDPPERRGRSRVPPPDYDEQLVREQWLDEQLLAALYEAPLAESGDGRVAYGRGPEARAATRARNLAQGAALGWAVDVDGNPLSARDVERWLRADELLQGYGPWRYLDDDGRVLARWGECFDRNFDGRCDDLSAGTDGCFDRNLDGRCDDARWDRPGCPPSVRCADGYREPGRTRVDDRYGSRYDDRYGPGATGRDASLGLCFDRDQDGRCDEPWSAGRAVPQTLPAMTAAVGLQRGVASYDVERWLRRSDASARVSDRDGDGLPERVIWLDPRGQVVQVWTDRNGDGIADRVELFRDGLPVQVVER